MPQHVKANLKPRDVQDALVCALIGLFLVLVLTVGPGFAVYALTSSIGAGVIAGLAFYALYLAHVVKELELSDRGVRFVRRLGYPREIAWAELERVEIVSPSEVIIWGWFLPPFPAREMSPSFSMHGHVAFRWAGRTTYFPCEHPDAFVEMARTRMRADETFYEHLDI
jgi:hypothetical protein